MVVSRLRAAFERRSLRASAPVDGSLDTPFVSAEFGLGPIDGLLLRGERLTGGRVSPRLVLFCLIGGLGLGVQLAVLWILKAAHLDFFTAQALAILIAMAANYVLNNEITYRRLSRRGVRFFTGHLLFCLACSVGAIVNFGAAVLVLHVSHNWTLAGAVGAIAGALFNFGAAKRLVWGEKRPGSGRESAAS